MGLSCSSLYTRYGIQDASCVFLGTSARPLFQECMKHALAHPRCSADLPSGYDQWLLSFSYPPPGSQEVMYVACPAKASSVLAMLFQGLLLLLILYTTAVLVLTTAAAVQMVMAGPCLVVAWAMAAHAHRTPASA